MIRLQPIAFPLILAVFGAWAGEPELTSISQDGPAHPNQAFTVTYEVSWTGEPGDYAILPPQIEAIEWGTAEIGATVASVREERQVIAHSVSFVPDEPGEVRIPAVRVGYIDRLVEAARAEAAPGVRPPEQNTIPRLKAEGFPLEVTSDRTALWVFSGVSGSAVALCLCLGTVYWMRRKPEAVSEPGPADSVNSLRGALNQARRHRLDGQHYEFFAQLHRTVSLLDSSDAADRLRKKLEQLGQDVGYRGYRPTEDELTGAERDVERLMAQTQQEGV